METASIPDHPSSLHSSRPNLHCLQGILTWWFPCRLDIIQVWPHWYHQVAPQHRELTVQHHAWKSPWQQPPWHSMVDVHLCGFCLLHQMRHTSTPTNQLWLWPQLIFWFTLWFCLKCMLRWFCMSFLPTGLSTKWIPHCLHWTGNQSYKKCIISSCVLKDIL